MQVTHAVADAGLQLGDGGAGVEVVQVVAVGRLADDCPEDRFGVGSYIEVAEPRRHRRAGQGSGVRAGQSGEQPAHLDLGPGAEDGGSQQGVRSGGELVVAAAAAHPVAAQRGARPLGVDSVAAKDRHARPAQV